MNINDLLANISYDEFKGLNVTFINMPLRESAMPNTPPEGPLLLAAILRQYGAETHLLDFNAYRIKDGESLKRGSPNGRHLSEDEAEAMLIKHIDNKGDQDIIAFSGIITTG